MAMHEMENYFDVPIEKKLTRSDGSMDSFVLLEERLRRN